MQYNITYRRKDGGWQYIISFKEGNKWRQRSKQGFKTKRIAQIGADQRLEELKEEWNENKNTNTMEQDITFKEYTMLFLKDEELHKEKNSLLVYKNSFAKFRQLNEKKLKDITPRDIQRCVDDMIRNGYKLTTVKLYTGKVSTSFNRAINFYKFMLENPVKNIRFPENKEDTEKNRALTKAEFYNLLSHLDHPQEYMTTFLAGACGLRVGEIMGLTWDNVNFDNKTILVKKQWKRLKNGKMGMGTVKSKNSNRIVPIPPKLLKELKKYKINHPTDMDNRVIIYKSLSSISSYLVEKYRKIGYDISIHDLRHTYATTLIANGVDFKTVAKLMGHEVEQTIKTYSHVTDEMMRGAVATLNNIFE